MAARQSADDAASLKIELPTEEDAVGDGEDTVPAEASEGEDYMETYVGQQFKEHVDPLKVQLADKTEKVKEL